MTNNAARHSGKQAQIVCMAPDVCKTPMGSSMVPVPYMIISKLSASTDTIPSTTFGGLEAFTMKSRTSTVEGDEAGTGGGVKSGTNLGWCRPISNKTTVFVEGKEVIQHTCFYDMNCSGPNGAGNTVGKLQFDQG
ncbi:DUF4150 domain-containing protein [Thalassococcus sp. S3]|uniref:DUF4150 domain-containing protein n=1 Tax=Thalassococcus sp. S3 TaxID=2017482 RepID=UPI00102438F8|nr:DUF4150 domain-containing protein [Thalassococcus sp. S3]QBF33644.1 hypothetical protein CFI11_20850 [Thalassococcus sp. S3]